MRVCLIKIVILVSLILTTNSISAQYKFGFQGGMGISDYVGKDYSNVSDPKTGIVAGLSYERELNLTLSISTELNYEQKGTYYEFYPRDATEVSVNTRTSYISLPVLVKAYFGQNANIFIYSGLTVSRLTNHTISHSANEYGYEILSEPFFPFKLNNWDVSVNAGFGINFYDIVLDIRYHHGAVNIYEGENAPSIRNHFLSATIGYVIFKKKVVRCFNSR